MRHEVGVRHRWVEAMEALGALRPRQRRLLGLQAGGARLPRDVGRDGRLVADCAPPLVRAHKSMAAAQ
jgi:hypothetical protein